MTRCLPELPRSKQAYGIGGNAVTDFWFIRRKRTPICVAPNVSVLTECLMTKE